MATVPILDYTDILLCAREVNFSLGEGEVLALIKKELIIKVNLFT